jgi:hypothetical protein
MKNKRKRKIHRDKNGREFIKEAYFVGGKIKFHRIYVIDGIPANEFYEKNATDLVFYLNGDFELINSEKDFSNHYKVRSKNNSNLLDYKDLSDLPF